MQSPRLLIRLGFSVSWHPGSFFDFQPCERQPRAGARTGKKRSEHKPGPAFRATPSGALQAWAEITKALAASPDPADRKLSKNIVDFGMQTAVAQTVQRHRAAQRHTELPGMGRPPGRSAQPLRPEPNRGPDVSR